MRFEDTIQTYTLDQLYDSSRNINRLEHPARARTIDALIQQKEREIFESAHGKYSYKNTHLLTMALTHLLLSLAGAYLMLTRWPFSTNELAIALWGMIAVIATKSVVSLISHARLIRVYRYIELTDDAITLPEKRNSSRKIRIPVAEIFDLYLKPATILEPGQTLHICWRGGADGTIWSNSISTEDFRSICIFLKTKLGMASITTI